MVYHAAPQQLNVVSSPIKLTNATKTKTRQESMRKLLLNWFFLDTLSLHLVTFC